MSISASDVNQSDNITDGNMQNIINQTDTVKDVNTNTELNSDIIDDIDSTENITLNPGEYNISNVTISKNTTISGNGNPEDIVINGGNTGNPIFTINGTDVFVKFENVTFINGYNTITTGGSVVDNYYGNVIINNCIFKNNNGYNGGALSSQEGNLTVTNSIFTSNRADNDGGAIKGDYYNSLYVENCTFTDNYANRDGGAIGSTRISKAYINNCIFENNTGREWAGALYNWASTMYVNNSIINNNTGQLYYAGAIMTSGPLYINNTIITNNYAGRNGGALCLEFETETLLPAIYMENSCIFNNSAGRIGKEIYLSTEIFPMGEIILNNNWWGVNNPLNSTDYLYNWSNRVINLNIGKDHVLDSWINMDTVIDNTTNTITVQAKYTTNETTVNADNFKIPEKVIFLNSTESYLNNGVATYTYNQPLNMSSEITRVDYQTYPEVEKNETNTTVGTVFNVLSDEYYYYNGNENNISHFIVQLKDTNGNTLSNRRIGINVCGKTYYRTTDENGKASLAIRLNARTYTVTCIYNGTNNTNGTELIKNITVKKNSVTMSANSNVKKGNYYTVKITSNSKPVIGQKVVITVRGKNYYRVTDKNGQVKLKINLNPKTYTIKTTLLNCTNFNSKTLTQKLTVKK